MPWAEAKLVVEPSVRDLCVKPYAGHKKGCPNFGRRLRCPPSATLIGEALDLQDATWVIWTYFDLGAHVDAMRAKHPGWSERQLACCLYWQSRARRNLKAEVWAFLRSMRKRKMDHWLRVVSCPEACGINVTLTMAALGVELEWPPRRTAYQVVVAGTPRSCADEEEVNDEQVQGLV